MGVLSGYLTKFKSALHTHKEVTITETSDKILLDVNVASSSSSGTNDALLTEIRDTLLLQKEFEPILFYADDDTTIIIRKQELDEATGVYTVTWENIDGTPAPTPLSPEPIGNSLITTLLSNILTEIQLKADLTETQPVNQVNIDTVKTIHNETAPAIANTEFTFNLPANTKNYLIKSRNKGILKIATTSGGNFVTLPTGAIYTDENFYTGLTLYISSNKSSDVVEIVTHV